MMNNTAHLSHRSAFAFNINLLWLWRGFQTINQQVLEDVMLMEKKSYKSYEMLTDIVFNKHEVFGNCIVRLDLFSMFLHENGIK